MLKKFLYMALLGAVMTSCSENLMDEINKDESNPPASSVNAKFQITDAIVGTGYSTWGGAYAWYVASFTEQIFGTGNNQLMKAELRMRSETAASSTYNNEWNATYGNLMNIKQIIEKCEKQSRYTAPAEQERIVLHHRRSKGSTRTGRFSRTRRSRNRII